jgi:hypothetical protein
VTDFYRDDQTRSAQSMLMRLREIVPDAIILGGWAVFLYTRGQRSNDVDIAVDFADLGRIQAAFPGQVTRNNNLRKYELKDGGVEVDILVAHLSNAGIPVELLLEPTSSLAGFRVMSPEGLLAMKMCAWMDRRHTPKGLKDEADAVSLLSVVDIDWTRYESIIASAEPKYAGQFPGSVARLVLSMDQRASWRYIKVNGENTVAAAAAWKALRQRLGALIPRGR